MQLYIVRHAETHWNVEHRIQGWSDSKLTETGVCQAKALAERLKNLRLNAIYSSDSGRAVTTAQCIALWHGIDVIPVKELRETSWGEWEGMTAEEIAVRYPEEWEKFSNRDIQEHKDTLEIDSVSHVPGGETVAQASERMIRGLDMILSKHSGENDTALLVGHGGSLRFLITKLIGISPMLAKRFHLDNTSISLFQVGPNMHGVVHGINDISHLMANS